MKKGAGELGVSWSNEELVFSILLGLEQGRGSRRGGGVLC